MLDTQIVLAIYAAALLYLAGNLAGPSWMRRPNACELPRGLRLGVRLGTVAGVALLAWAGLADRSPTVGWGECAALMAVLVESLVFLKIAMHRDHGVYGHAGGGA
ncbi:hypothetical protein GO308_15130 [Sphingomonas sp. SFZ2018-12]|uniref:hypothetical protein n=1 Tax=Sphingomonas sp. SFZ2018-12 TaxID=2683197 RepID=UPI001F0E90CD|nr:hypothetical protein [Sphingomonas sp. SFZ2018-12]MCH4894450.1 hypothetical protein [Sphingomonas sp. SFZ2018-12]